MKIDVKNIPHLCRYCELVETGPVTSHFWSLNIDENNNLIGFLCKRCYNHLIAYPKKAIEQGRKFGTGSKRQIINKDIQRVCYSCGSDKSSGDWFFNYDINNSNFVLHVLCYDCYNHLVKTPNYAEREHAKNQFRFYYKRKEVFTDVVQRTGYCSLPTCHKNIYDGSCKLTNMHHIFYDDNDPEAGRIELCPSCHAKLRKSN